MGALLCLGPVVEGSPETVDLVFDVLSVGDQCFGVVSESVALLLVILLVLAKVIGDLDKPERVVRLGDADVRRNFTLLPDARPDKDVNMLRVRLHVRYCLDR